MAQNARMAMSTDFLEAFAKLPSAQQKGVRMLIAKFEANPRSPGLELRINQGCARFQHAIPARGPGLSSHRVPP